MIDLREEAYKKATSWLERFKIKHDLKSIVPRYACRTVADFFKNKDSIEQLSEAIMPRLIYTQNSKTIDDGKIYLPVTLYDKTGDLEVYVREQALNLATGNFIVDDVANLYNKDLILYAIIRKGFPDVNIYGGAGIDDKLYLTGIWSPRIKKSQSSFKTSKIITDMALGPSPELNPLDC